MTEQERKVKDWIDACPFPLYTGDEERLWNLYEANTEDDGPFDC